MCVPRRLLCITRMALFLFLTGEALAVCPKGHPPPEGVSRSSVYKGQPFRAGEEAMYMMQYSAVRTHVGYDYLRVRPPVKQELVIGADGRREKRWHMVFQAEAYSGDWYKAIFQGHYRAQALALPGAGIITRFYINTNQKPAFKDRTRKEKWLDFRAWQCRVATREVDHTAGGKEKKGEHDLSFGSVDVLGTVYRMRSINYKPGKKERIPVYSNEENWWLEVTPVAFEKTEVEAGFFDTVKLSLQTYVGKDLQQKGEVFVWIATKHPNRPLVKVEADIKMGNVFMILAKFKPGS